MPVYEPPKDELGRNPRERREVIVPISVSVLVKAETISHRFFTITFACADAGSMYGANDPNQAKECAKAALAAVEVAERLRRVLGLIILQVNLDFGVHVWDELLRQ